MPITANNRDAPARIRSAGCAGPARASRRRASLRGLGFLVGEPALRADDDQHAPRAAKQSARGSRAAARRGGQLPGEERGVVVGEASQTIRRSPRASSISGTSRASALLRRACARAGAIARASPRRAARDAALAVERQRTRAAPSSVPFSTTKSIRLPFGTACATSSAQAPERRREPLARAVGAHERRGPIASIARVERPRRPNRRLRCDRRHAGAARARSCARRRRRSRRWRPASCAPSTKNRRAAISASIGPERVFDAFEERTLLDRRRRPRVAYSSRRSRWRLVSFVGTTT